MAGVGLRLSAAPGVAFPLAAAVLAAALVVLAAARAG
jgi:hypothetical protein